MDFRPIRQANTETGPSLVNPLFLIFGFVLVVAQFVVPRRIAFVPLLIAACHFQNVAMIQLGASFSIVKLVIMAGLLRAAYERMLVWSSRYSLDVLVAVWACWAIVSGFAHHAADYNPMTLRLSMVYENVGTYLYARSFFKNQEDLLRLSKWLALVLVPLALLLLIEKTTGQNFYAAIAGEIQESAVREGHVRAAGPFSHPILAGTAGASSAILLMSLWRRDSRLAVAGVAACGLIVFCSASSGPILTLFSGLAALGLWRWRKRIGCIRTCLIVGIFGLQFVMKAPVWYLLARIDLAGGSTGYHRAELITQAINHIDRWWLLGTDYTRDWMPYGIMWSADQIDITNYYLKMGVIGGLPLMLCFIALLFKAFQLLGKGMRARGITRVPAEFVLWCLGATLFAHCVTFLSISYFDQSYALLFLVIGAVPGACAAPIKRPVGVASTGGDVGMFSTERRGNEGGAEILSAVRGLVAN